LLFPSSHSKDNGKSLFVQAISLAHGEYVARLDGDDYWTSPFKLQKEVDQFNRDRDCMLCFHNALRVYDDGSREPAPYTQPDDVPATIEDLLRANVIAGCAPMLRKSVIANLAGWYLTLLWDDWPLYVLAAKQGTIAYI